jgi:prepilin-type processing-associated H-X9-DG protein
MICSALSLLELVIVLAIISILLLLFSPAIASCRLESQAIVCSSHLKAISTSLKIDDHQYSRFPAAVDSTSIRSSLPHTVVQSSIYDQQGTWWFDTLKKDQSISGSQFWCPSRKTTDAQAGSNILCANYGVNLSICKAPVLSKAIAGNQPISSLKVSFPASTMLVTDSGYGSVAWYHTLPQVISSGNPGQDLAYIPGIRANQLRALRPGTKTDAFSGRHRDNRLNLVYVDGHSSRIKSSEFITAPNQNTPTRIWLP